MADIMDILSPLTPHASSCGYCGPPGERSKTKSSVHQAECMPLQLSCKSYQKMIDRGWRRSGTFCYKPDMKKTCCPQYTIKLDALEFKPSRSQRHCLTAELPKTPPFSLVSSIHASEKRFLTEEVPAHEFEVTLESASYTDEKFTLYKSYQKEIHLEQVEKRSEGFKNFLVETPLRPTPIPYPGDRPAHLPPTYGSYHQMYRLDGHLIAIGVLDILPNCVSSVYFMYDKKWERFSLGKLSALREAALAREIHEAGVPDMNSLYMGYYIHTCQKMRYKGDYSPSYLLDPEECTWHPLEKCRPILDQHRYACFAHPEHSHETPDTSDSRVPNPPDEIVRDIKLLKQTRDGYTALPLPLSPEWKRPSAKRAILITAEGLGYDLAREVLFFLAYEL
ncbi:hypothetical protein OBBRIDRAFT_819164 [Obba rivulosa]|uniref:arginyltransferase n=1 Tax=Obba rivulosa TaxID=1052685 RepID=A0A8E2ATK3_9APHY|nr:hypothetical protein OBBRIDRAFT_819164 [Obba rivulosa]